MSKNGIVKKFLASLSLAGIALLGVSSPALASIETPPDHFGIEASSPDDRKTLGEHSEFTGLSHDDAVQLKTEMSASGIDWNNVWKVTHTYIECQWWATRYAAQHFPAVGTCVGANNVWYVVIVKF